MLVGDSADEIRALLSFYGLFSGDAEVDRPWVGGPTAVTNAFFEQ